MGNGYDLALIKLNRISDKNPVKIQEKGAKEGSVLKSVGLGRQSARGGFATNLQVAEVSVLDKKECDKIYDDTTLQTSVLCSNRESEFCLGDEGGPLIDTITEEDKLVGIAHLKHPSDVCGTSDFPGLYADIRHSRSWIKKTLKSFSKKS